MCSYPRKSLLFLFVSSLALILSHRSWHTGCNQDACIQRTALMKADCKLGKHYQTQIKGRGTHSSPEFSGYFDGNVSSCVFVLHYRFSGYECAHPQPKSHHKHPHHHKSISWSIGFRIRHSSWNFFSLGSPREGLLYYFVDWGSYKQTSCTVKCKTPTILKNRSI